MLKDLDGQSYGKSPWTNRKSNRNPASGNTSTNTSKTRGNSQVGSDSKLVKTKSSYTPASKQVSISKIGTQNDNFLVSFVSLREKEKKKPVKAKKINKADEEAWFTELTNLSFNSELDEHDIDEVIREFLPEYSKKSKELTTEKRKKSKKVMDEECNECEITVIYNDGAKDDFGSACKEENDMCNVAKWTLGGVDLMINDIKQELGLDDSFTKSKEDNPTFDVFSDDEVENEEINILGLDRIDQYINHDMVLKDKNFYDQKVSKIPKFGERSKIPVLGIK